MKNSRSLALILPSLLAAHSVGLAAQDGPVFEEVLVTAEKRTESLQNLSQAVPRSPPKMWRIDSCLPL